MATADLNCIQALYDRGLYLQAYALLKPYKPLRDLKGTAERILAGRLAGHLGATNLGAWLFLQAYRQDPTDPQARTYYAYTTLQRHGPLAAWKVLQRYDDLPDATAAHRSEWMALAGFVAGTLRDFETAESWLARAEAITPDDPWIWTERAAVLERADRYEEALAAARHALDLHPWYRPGVQAVAHTLQLLGRDEEALDLLAEAASHLECGQVVAQQIILQLEMQRYEGIPECLDRFLHLNPLAEEEAAQWVAGIRSEVAYHLGDIPGAIQAARQAGGEHFTKLADRMEAASAARYAARILLPVGFVRQHHKTCVPATLSALSRYWQMPADHLSIAEQICYDGTPWHNERRWAEQNGWIAREFTVTWESATALLDRGIPFTLTTAAPGYAHLQAVIGYDARRGIFLIRDPYHRNIGEADAEALLDAFRAIGPRGMAMVPHDRAALLEADSQSPIPGPQPIVSILPDADLYDRLYRLQIALTAHHREEARAVYEEMSRIASDNPITLQGRRALAAYDQDVTALLDCIERLLARFPQDANLQLARLACLRQLARRDERLRLLEELCARPPQKSAEDAESDDEENVEPLFWLQYAQELSADAREHERALGLLRRALRRRPTEAAIFIQRAHILWHQRQFKEALELYRFAACLEDKDEQHAVAYFIASRTLKQTDRALRFLQDRFHRFGAQSGQPARTLFWALSQLEQTVEAFRVLEEALKRRPDDADLLLFAAEERGRYGQFELAEAALAAAETQSARSDWLRAAASLALYRGEPAKALALWQQVLETEPLAADAHAAVARLLAETDSPTAALRHFERAAARFPHAFALHRLWAEWLRDGENAVLRERVLRRLMEMDPADAWTRRELALMLSHQRRFAEAFAEAETARRLDPADTRACTVLGEIYGLAGKWPEARAAYMEAIRLSVDNEAAIARLMGACDTAAERRLALDFITSELIRQTIFGDGLLAFRRYAQSTLPPDEVYGLLREALVARPDLWHAWSAAIQQLIDLDRVEEALDLAQQATARFPLQPALWLDLAAARAARQDTAGEREAVRQALQIAPGDSEAVRRFAESCERTGETEQAQALLEAAVARDPLEPANLAALAYILWQRRQKAAALERVRTLLRLEPRHEWAWQALREWCAALGRPKEAVEAARDYTLRRPGDSRAWLMLAQTLHTPADLPERLQALDRALALNARCFEACDLRAQLLAEENRFEEALAACRLPEGQAVPTILRGRAAWIEAQRGHVKDAIAQMREVVAEDPNYAWGWLQLALWHKNAGAEAGFAEAARRLTALNPQEAYGFVLLGEACLSLGDRAGARQALSHALELEPGYTHAGQLLCDAQLDDNDLEAAAQTVARLRQTGRDGWAQVCAVQLALRRNDSAAAQESLRELCLFPEEVSEPLQAAQQALHDHGWGLVAEQVFLEALEQPQAQESVGELWIKSAMRRGDRECERHVARLLPRGPAGSRAAAAYMEALAKSRRYPDLRRFLQQHRERLRADTRAWGGGLYALVAMRDYGKALAWSQDWEQRRDVRPWMLLNRVLALRHTGQAQEAARVSRFALTLPEDHCTPRHALWLALDAALAGTPGTAERFAGQAEAESLPPYYQFLQGLIAAMLEMQRANPSQRQAAFTAARQQLAQARKIHKTYARDRILSRAYRRGVRRIARDAGRFDAALWAVYHQVLTMARTQASGS